MNRSDVLSPQEQRILDGLPIGWIGDGTQSNRSRVYKKLEGFRDQPIQLNVDRAVLFTESFKETEGQPIVLRWAKALTNILENHPIYIEEDDLVVGSAGPPGRYSIVYPELAGSTFSKVEQLEPSQPGDSMAIDAEQIKILRDELKPYWSNKQYHRAFGGALPDDTRDVVKGKHIVTCTAISRHMLAWTHDYEKVLKGGIKDIRRKAQDRLDALDPFETKDIVEKKPFLEAVVMTCDAIVVFANRYALLAREMAAEAMDEDRRKELLEIAEICQWVPENPARTFREAVQSQWLIQTVSRFEQRMGGTVSNGRMDQYLHPYYKKDMEEGRITDDEVLLLLETMWLGMAKCVEIYQSPGKMSFTEGYAHWEAVTIGGQTRDGKDATNELSYLMLQSKREFPLNYPDLSARIHSQTPNAFLHAVAETIKEGVGYPKLFFDEEIIPLLVAKGGEVEEANDYCICGCTEVKMVNRDAITTGCAWINLGAIVEMALYDGVVKKHGRSIGANTGDAKGFAVFDDVWNAFRLQAENLMKHVFIQQYIADKMKPDFFASPMNSMLHDLCMESCMDMQDGPIEGAVYLGFFDTIGFGTAIDSLAAIKKVVFDDKRITMAELLEALDSNFEGKEAIRQMCLNAPKYGNNDPYADSIGRDIEELFAGITRGRKTAFGGELDVRYVTITAHVPFGSIIGATPDGRKAGETVSDGVAPSQGADRNGPTASLNSVANTRAGSYKERAARLLNMKLSPAAVAGESGTRKLMSLIRTACDLKMWHLQFNIINRDTLIAAQKEPEKYRDLLVRVAGYSAYFTDLTPQLQNEIIQRTEHSF
ncbi:MAG: glycyl radical protein [Proteobacteria bacterium]|nr:glycyl radical protein [Pseudomonadota bacterium]